jgi:2-oxoglutarate ferredoxin oxidoreductase subunit gamma
VEQMKKLELRLAGSGGQGVILATVILAEAAVLSGLEAAQSQSYGPEARGGSCKAEVLISDEPIAFTKVQRPTLLMALTQSSLDKYTKVLYPSFLMALTQKALETYGHNLPEDCLVLIDESLEPLEDLKNHKVVQLPILRTAVEKVGKAMTANIVAVGAINELMKLTSREELKESVFMHIPKGTEALNGKALEEGIKLVEEMNV